MTYIAAMWARNHESLPSISEGCPTSSPASLDARPLFRRSAEERRWEESAGETPGFVSDREIEGQSERRAREVERERGG